MFFILYYIIIKSIVEGVPILWIDYNICLHKHIEKTKIMFSSIKYYNEMECLNIIYYKNKHIIELI